MNPIDRFLNNLTMYRLVVYVLGAYVGLGIIVAFTGRVSSSPTSLVMSLALVLIPAYLVDRGFGRLFKVPTNMESALITSLILFLIVQPADSLAGGLALALAGAASSASKFLLAWNGKHIFNPAAFGAALLSLTGLQATTWWIGSSAFWPFTLLLGLVVARKIRRFPLVIVFGVVSVAFQAILFLHGHEALSTNMKHALLASPLIFLGTIMLTEPATMPPRRGLQVIFGAMVAIFYIGAWRVGPLEIYPEVALLLGNIFAYAVSPKFRIRLELTEIQRLSTHVANYVFIPERHFDFLPGQYMEWTLAGVPYDSRGNRRTFTIASSPTEPTVQLGMKYYEPASMYKAVFEKLRPGDIIYGGQLAGNFTLKGTESKKLAFLAGGIGITPFRSMVKYLVDTDQHADIVLVYEVSDPREFAYTRELQAARRAGVKLIPIVTNPAHPASSTINAKVSAELLAQLIPDYEERLFYISGPSSMVDHHKHYLHQLGVYDHRIKTDHFSGY
jgi:ferredoxin-NADP reductase